LVIVHDCEVGPEQVGAGGEPPPPPPPLLTTGGVITGAVVIGIFGIGVVGILLQDTPVKGLNNVVPVQPEGRVDIVDEQSLPVLILNRAPREHSEEEDVLVFDCVLLVCVFVCAFSR
jgi:hypothetical protein